MELIFGITPATR